MPGLFVGQYFDRGHLKIPLAVSSVLLAVSTLLVAQCKVYWQFLLCQGFAVGVRLPLYFRLKVRFDPGRL
jgi:MFS transporter, MCT family, solute carrier family 16 (monocarboxylic acid transporters), member 10